MAKNNCCRGRGNGKKKGRFVLALILIFLYNSLYMNPFVMVIFGATGDLAKKKLIPALFSLFKQKQLPEQFFVVGFARREYSVEDFAGYFPEYTADSEWKFFSSHLLYQQGVFEEEKGY